MFGVCCLSTKCLGTPAKGGLAEPRRGEATNAEHTIWLRILNEIRTFFRENLDSEF